MYISSRRRTCGPPSRSCRSPRPSPAPASETSTAGDPTGPARPGPARPGPAQTWQGPIREALSLWGRRPGLSVGPGPGQRRARTSAARIFPATPSAPIMMRAAGHGGSRAGPGNLKVWAIDFYRERRPCPRPPAVCCSVSSGVGIRVGPGSRHGPGPTVVPPCLNIRLRRGAEAAGHGASDSDWPHPPPGGLPAGCCRAL